MKRIFYVRNLDTSHMRMIIVHVFFACRRLSVSFQKLPKSSHTSTTFIFLPCCQTGGTRVGFARPKVGMKSAVGRIISRNAAGVHALSISQGQTVHQPTMVISWTGVDQSCQRRCALNGFCFCYTSFINASWNPLWNKLLVRSTLPTGSIYLNADDTLRPKPLWNIRIGNVNGKLKALSHNSFCQGCSDEQSSAITVELDVLWSTTSTRTGGCGGLLTGGYFLRQISIYSSPPDGQTDDGLMYER